MSAEHSYPISYVRSMPGDTDFMVLKPTFKFDGKLDPAWRISADSSDAVIGTEPVGFVQSNGVITATLIAPLPGTILSDTLTIKFEISLNGGPYGDPNLVPFAVMKIHLYVTGAPAQGAFQTVLWLGCDAAKGLAPANPGESAQKTDTNAENILDAIFDKYFTSLSVIDVSGYLLAYWGSHFGLGHYFPNSDRDIGVGDLLKFHDGRCGEWAGSFFPAIAAAEGVTILWKDLEVNFLETVPVRPRNGTPGFDITARAQGGLVPGERWFHDHVIDEYLAADGSCVLLDPSYGVRVSGGTISLAQLNWGTAAIAGGVKGDWVTVGGIVTSPANDEVPTGYVQDSAYFAMQAADFDFPLRGRHGYGYSY